MKFYIVSDDYITHLKTVDKHVPDNYGEGRAYIGIVMKIDGINYLAPLTSHKLKHNLLKAGLPTIFKMHELDNEENKLGMVQLSNMIPVLDSEVHLLDIDAQSQSYQKLLNLQQQFLRKNSDRLVKKAQKLYRLVTVNKINELVAISCNFKSLEAAMDSFVPASQRNAL
ncbi:type III toxin-antitoxin system ToxN/AbiQ family toxin [Shewanella algae]